MHIRNKCSLTACLGLILAAWTLAGCAGSQVSGLSAAGDGPAAPALVAAPNGGADAAGLPAGLPVDYQQPWEQLDAFGLVVPESAQRESSAVDLSSEFKTGVDRFSEAGDVSNYDQASSIGSGIVGSAELSHAIYRLPLGVAQPGVVSVDVNLRARSDGSLSDYWLGVSDFGSGQWRWRGPLSDGQLRLSLPVGDYTSELGNLFVAIAAYDGSAVDVVGVGANPRNGGDLVAPSAPAAPLLTPVAGGVLMVWLPVAASDLAGYRIYYSSQPFLDGNSTGVRRVEYLDASRRFILKQPGHVYVRLTAVDISGNESPVSPQVDAEALAGEPLEMVLETDLVSGLLGDSANLTATGGDSYDFDLDGDGVFEITGDVTGVAALSAQNTGIIRPRVRANMGGTSMALGAVSLIIAAQIPPVAIVDATPNEGVLWRQPEALSVTFDASLSYDQDGAGLEYAFDPLGDGTFTAWNASDSYIYEYTEKGTFLAAMRVKDDDGLIAHSSALVEVKQVAGFNARGITRFNNNGQYSSLAIVDGHPAITMFDASSNFLVYMRATDSGGNLWGDPMVLDNTVGAGLHTSLAVIDGKPAVSYYVSGPNEVRYLRADDAQGTSWTNAPVVIDGPINLAPNTSLYYVDGNPAVAYADAGAGTLKYRRATSGAGTGDTAADWVDAPLTLDASGDVGGYPSPKVISGNPAITYWDINNLEALYRRAVNTTGATAGNWPVAPARCSPAGVVVGGYTSLLEVNGRPAVSFFEVAVGSLQYIRASTSSGAVTADWPLVTVQVASGGSAGQYNSLALVNGRPAISFSATVPWVSLYYSRATNTNGTVWDPPVTVKSHPAEAAGFYSSLVDIDGLPAISYWGLAFSTIEFATPILN